MSRTILILGATSAIAAACARIWAQEKASFFLVARDGQKLQAVADDLQARGATAVHCHTLDFNNFADHGAMFAACAAQFPTLDIALLAHGTLPDQAACEAKVEVALEGFTSNGLSLIALLTPLANRMEAQKHGTIAVISSVAADRGRPSNYVYGSAKAAVATFCEGLRARLHKAQVHVLLIKPGFVATPMTQGLDLPKLLLATSEKVAGNITRAIEAKRDVLYTPWFWRWIMLIICHIPGKIFKKLNL